ncbi:DUF3575 domain-containing protein [Rhodocytophaga rosea]|uniref:DUF3575 domain-containing protein n=1 Tax=Rhodocytophaga rosea TaxID=2704465 RepID=A0A6C0GL89_9BACT|nr:DUF3575 domain-containing protein [Rhodocytophaga rosea]QHT68410.1 DUF3575 domain-containing protein [Rhodocytophaga rosea]
MKKSLLLLLLPVLMCAECFSQTTDSLPVKHDIKLRLPFWYKGFFTQTFLTGLQYERLLSTKNSVSLGISYYYSNRNYFDGRSTVDNYRQFMVLPQWRHYFRRNKQNYFNGFHLGASAVYLRDYIDRPNALEKRHVMGLGILVGYQQVIKKKISLGITPSLHVGLENTNYNRHQNARINRRFSTIFIVSPDFHIGYIF